MPCRDVFFWTGIESFEVVCLKRKLTVLFSSVAMLILILDTKTMVIGATEGITLCLRTVIPSLFPFILLSSILTSSIMGFRLPFSNFWGKILRIPKNCESIFAIGMIGGYPAGAQAVVQAVERDLLSPAEGQRMLLFCNNAGPSFIFGMGLTLFRDPVVCWYVWAIQILSACIIGILTPGSRSDTMPKNNNAIHTYATLAKAIKVMALICGWVIIFRIGLTYATKYLLAGFPSEWQALISGSLELTNGCMLLQKIHDRTICFIMVSVLLAFGGLCVTMQTNSVTNSAGMKISGYLIAKVCQAIIAGSLASILAVPIYHIQKTTAFFFIAAGVVSILAYRFLIARFLQNCTGNNVAVVV